MHSRAPTPLLATTRDQTAVPCRNWKAAPGVWPRSGRMHEFKIFRARAPLPPRVGRGLGSARQDRGGLLPSTWRRRVGRDSSIDGRGRHSRTGDESVGVQNGRSGIEVRGRRAGRRLSGHQQAPAPAARTRAPRPGSGARLRRRWLPSRKLDQGLMMNSGAPGDTGLPFSATIFTMVPPTCTFGGGGGRGMCFYNELRRFRGTKCHRRGPCSGPPAAPCCPHPPIPCRAWPRRRPGHAANSLGRQSSPPPPAPHVPRPRSRS